MVVTAAHSSRSGQVNGAETKPLRVAHVIQNLNYGGMERVLHNLARKLPAHGFEVHVVVLQYLGRFAEELDGLATFHQVPRMSRLSFVHPGKLVDVLRRIEPHVMHSHSGVWFKSARAARLAGIPIVHTEHGRPDPVPFADRLIDNCASRWTDITVAVSEPLAKVLAEQVVRYPERLRVLANGVDTETLHPVADPARLKGQLGLPPDALVIGSVGRLEPIKHYDLAIRAFAHLRQQDDAGASAWLVLVGDGSERQALERLAHELGVADRVKFCGWRNDADRMYGAFDIFTLPSLSEGTSISLLEAMSTAVCPIVTDVGGNGAVLGPELAALLVPSDDAEALAANWAKYLRSPLERAAAGRTARARVESEFSLTRMVAQYAALYRELAARPVRA